MSIDLTELRNLPVSEKLCIAEALWDDISASDEPIVLQPWQRDEAQRRRAELKTDPSCERRHSSIWTMEMETENKTTKMLTIEVRLLSRTIVQVRGKLNRLHTDKEKSVIERWAAASKLKLQVGID